MFRFRIHYKKTDALRYTSNLDMHKIWERALRRAGLPLAYSQGFHPQPKINQACPLPLGILSRAELVDIWLEQDFSPEYLIEKIALALPAGISIVNISLIDQKEPALPTQILASEYEVLFLEPVTINELSCRVEMLLNNTNLPRKRRNKEYDLRPLILSLSVKSSKFQQDPYLSMTLSARESATGRPEEVISALGFDPYTVRIERTALILTDKS